MQTIHARNVNQAFPQGVRLLRERGIARPSRNGPVIEVPEPVATVFERPLERVLFLPERDANPFLHFFESLWMLAGRDDVTFPGKFAKQMFNYSDDGVTLWGAYGYRWRNWFGFDQLPVIINLLRSDPDSRRGVLTMWSPPHDLGPNMPKKPKDLPCNTMVYFKIREGALHMTVCNRSNDMLWGAYGANVVHMSFLQEYMAAKIGVPPEGGRSSIVVGPYTQVSDSFHVYTESESAKIWGRVQNIDGQWSFATSLDPYESEQVAPYPLGAESADWDDDLAAFFGHFEENRPPTIQPYKTAYWNNVVVPMWRAWRFRDVKQADHIMAPDWREAAVRWVIAHPKKHDVSEARLAEILKDTNSTVGEET